MSGWFARLRDVVWTSVLAVVLAVVGIILALAGVGSLAVPAAFGLSSITMALLSQRV